MCGIAGFLKLHEPADPRLLRSMCDRIYHRGPDEDGYFTEDGCGIGTRRLSIIDLSTGRQPIANEDRTIWVVFNGEVYNYRTLRSELLAQGHQFRTGSDTEVLVHLYEQEGIEGVRRLRGMFAYGIWDSRRRRLYLARDRFGKKPLYFACLPEGLYFGSELKCLVAAGVPREINHEALRLYFHFGYIPEPYTCYRDVHKLDPGGWLTYDASGELRQGRYWRLPPPAGDTKPGFTEEEASQKLRSLFDESVKLRLEADVPLGAFLSGGIDSSLVVASMARQTSQAVRTFSIGFEEAAFNETSYARMVAERYATDHREIIVRPDSVELVERIVRHLDEPFADSSVIPTYIVSEFARRHVKVALSGDGGDEFFAGYDSLAWVERLRWADHIPAFVRRAASSVAAMLPYSARGKNYLHAITRRNAMERYFQFNYAPYAMEQRLLSPAWLPPADAAVITSALPDCILPPGADPISEATYFEATANLTGDMLVKVDRMSMAASLEVRCPFLDHPLAEFAQSLPNSWKRRDGRGKRILLRALGDRLPPELLSRPKAGLAVPLPEWFRGPLREMLHDHLLGRDLAGRGIVSPTFVRELVEEHERGRRDNSNWLWMLLMLELWFRETARAPGEPSPVSFAPVV